MRRHFLSAVFAVAALFVATGQAAAQQYVDGARPTSMATAFTALSTGPPGMYHNPAGIATARMYAVSGTYEYTPQGNVLNASIIDSKTNPKLAAEAGYSYLIGHDNDDPSGHDIRLALAVPALPNRISVGIGGRYLILKQNNTEFARGLTLDAGLLFQILETFHAGVAAKNLLDICQQPARCRGVTPLTVSAGLAYGRTTPFTLSGDFNVDVNSEADSVNFGAEVGAEYMAAGKFPIRAGYNFDGLDTSHHVNLGFGWREKTFGLDVGGDINVQAPSDLTVSASFSLYFN